MLRFSPFGVAAVALSLTMETAGLAEETPESAPAAEATAESAVAIDELRAAAAAAAAEKEAAQESVAGVEAKLSELQQMLVRVQRDVQQAQTQVTTTEQTLAAAKETLAVAQAALTQAGEQIAAAQTEFTAAGEVLAATTSAWLVKAEALERALSAAGEWVSFRGEIAPILQSRCLTCHNVRMAKGGLNLESFASMMKGGESGPVIEPGDGELSNLCIQIEDGSMPKDADPLAPEQIALIKRWVALGAVLDAAVKADAPLLQIMPRVPQPSAPEAYPTPVAVTALEFSPDGQLLASSGYHELILWNAGDQQIARRMTNVAERVYDIAFSPDGARIAIAAGTPGEWGEVKIFQTADGAMLADLVTVEDAMFGVAFRPDGSKLAACGADRSIRVFGVATLQEEVHIEDHADWVLDVAWSADGSQLASASRDKTSKVFDAKTGDAVATFNGHGEVVNSVTFLPEGTQVATSGRDKHVRFWQVADAKEVRAIGGFGGDVLRIALLPDQRLCSACADGIVRLHNYGDGSEQKKFEGHSDWVFSLSVHAASGRLATGSFDGEIRLWTVEDAQAGAHWIAAPGYAPAQAAAN